MRSFVIAYPLSNNIGILKEITSDDYVIAVDQALLFCLENNIKVDLAIGDFDSLKSKELINKYSNIKLNIKKDRTDTYEAIKHAYEKAGEVILIGGIGGKRFEHSLANINLLQEFNDLVIYSLFSKIYLVKEGNKEVAFQGFISIFPYPDANITLEYFEYPLINYQFKSYDSIGISNELKEEKGLIIVHFGTVLVIETAYD